MAMILLLHINGAKWLLQVESNWFLCTSRAIQILHKRTCNVHTLMKQLKWKKTCISKYVTRLGVCAWYMSMSVCLSVCGSLFTSTFPFLFQFEEWHVQNPFDVKMKMTTSWNYTEWNWIELLATTTTNKQTKNTL